MNFHLSIKIVKQYSYSCNKITTTQIQISRQNGNVFFSNIKGQLISKCPFGIIVWTKIPTELFLDFCPEIFCTFLGASWKLFGASCRLPCLWYYILSPQEAQKASRKPPGSYKKIQGRNPEIFSLVFWMKLIFIRTFWNQLVFSLTKKYGGFYCFKFSYLFYFISKANNKNSMHSKCQIEYTQCIRSWRK